jgi:hypothetical protein
MTQVMGFVRYITMVFLKLGFMIFIIFLSIKLFQSHNLICGFNGLIQVGSSIVLAYNSYFLNLFV